MTKIKHECMFCEKEKNGKCSAKKNASVKLTKPRFCSKFVHSIEKEQAEIKRQAAAVSNGMTPTVHKTPEDYYQNLWSNHEIMVTPGVRYKLNHPGGK